jgi:hypothetical protein
MRLDAGFIPRRPGFDPGSGHVGFEVDKAAPGQVSSSTSVTPAKNFTDSSTLIIIHITRGWYNRPVVASVIVNSVPLYHKRKKISKWDTA